MISVTILTKNSSRYLQEVLESTRSFAEVLIFDNGSTDSTLSIAKSFPNVRVVTGVFTGFGPTHNVASENATYDWIFSLDSDEVITQELSDEILKLQTNPSFVYSVPRHNYYNGKWIRWCGWYPDRQFRLYNRKQTRFSDAQVHEAVIVDHMHVQPLNGAILHYSYDTTSEFLSKMQVYSDLFAKQYAGKRPSSIWKAISHAFFAFFKSYILKKGFMGGFEGYVISVYNGNTAFYKYLKLLEANRKIAKSSASNLQTTGDVPKTKPVD